MSRALRIPARFFYRLAARTLGLYESIILKRKPTPRYPPVFIIGPPRSGTTLLYQLLVHGYHFAYFNNLSVLFKDSPAAITALAKPFLKNYRSDFQSAYGRVRGAAAPHEGGEIWNRWFNIAYHYVGPGEPAAEIKFEIRATVAAMENIFRAPFLNKNVKNSVRIGCLKEIFPTAVFLEMRRNPVDTAVSILKSRRKNLSSDKLWWSVKPRQIESLQHSHYLRQVAAQVYYIHENIERDQKLFAVDDLHPVYYHRLCVNPERELDAIYRFLVSRGVPVRSGNTVIPASFPLQQGTGLPAGERRELEDLVAELFARDGWWSEHYGI